MSEPVSISSGWGQRTATDLISVLVELSRLLKALGFYAPGHPSRESLLDRAYRAWQAELRRAGPLEITLRNGSIWSEQIAEALEPGSMQELVGALETHGIEMLSFALDLDRETFSTFAELLCERESDDHFGFTTRFYPQSHPGIEVNGEAREEGFAMRPSSEPKASLGSALLNSIGSAMPMAPAPKPASSPSLQSASTPAPVEERVPPQPAPGRDPAPAPSPAPAQRKVLEEPLETPSQSMPGEMMRLALQELEDCTDDSTYELLVARVASSARELADGGQIEEGLRVAVVLADHAAGQSGCSGAQARMAQNGLELLAGDRLLDELMTRACARATHGIRPAQVLLQLGERAMPALLARLEQETDRESVSHLSAIVIALGEHAIPLLVRAISRESGRRTQLAIKLAGELQSPKLVPTLYAVLREGGPALQREAAKALVNIGNGEACDVLIKSLASKSEDLPRIAALSLGVLRDERAVQPLFRALEQASQQRSPQLAAELIRALGQFEGHRDILAPKLGAILDQRGVMRRRKQRAPKLAALAVLARQRTAEARRMIVGATRDPDAKVCEEARKILAGPEAR